MSDAQVYEFFYLYACKPCGRFYVLTVGDNEQPSCPQNHQYVELATKYPDHMICIDDTCKHFLLRDKTFPKDKCEGGCNKPGHRIKDLVDGSGGTEDPVLMRNAYRPKAVDTGTVDGLARNLKAELDSAEEFKSGHHSNKSGSHSYGADQMHSHGDHMNRITRETKVRAIKATLERMRAVKGFDPRDYAKLIERAEAYIKKYGGK